ncbi:peptide deformylase [Acetivibrio cellulolyticus]|uniref:peptide deformylase n=1 Tax=Acetivibrio cellulolyticus TaxID=35830 RepID=UPI0001E2D1B0|nr:peptide deformylase [Acetivibrio cellulolyticus]
MAILSVLKINKSIFGLRDISLRNPSRQIQKEELREQWFIDFIKDLFETLYYSPTGVGLAAPQVGVHIRLVAIDMDRDGKNPFPLINPTYEAVNDSIVLSNESCLSVPGFVGKVQRHEKIKLTYWDVNGEEIELYVEGFKAKVIQHEIDHLNGVLYIDRIDLCNDLDVSNGLHSIRANKVIEKLYNL